MVMAKITVELFVLFLFFLLPRKYKKEKHKTREGKRKTKQQKSLQITKEHEKQEYLVLFFITANG